MPTALFQVSNSNILACPVWQLGSTSEHTVVADQGGHQIELQLTCSDCMQVQYQKISDVYKVAQQDGDIHAVDILSNSIRSVVSTICSHQPWYICSCVTCDHRFDPSHLQPLQTSIMTCSSCCMRSCEQVASVVAGKHSYSLN